MSACTPSFFYSSELDRLSLGTATPHLDGPQDLVRKPFTSFRDRLAEILVNLVFM